MLPIRRSCLLACVLLLPACAGTETGNGQKDKDHTAKVEMRLTAVDGSVPGADFVGEDADGVALTVTEAWVSVETIDLWLADGLACSDVFDPTADVVLAADPDHAPRCSAEDDKLRIEGPFWIDLVTGASDPSLDVVYLPPGAYTRADVKLHPRTPANPRGDGIDDATLVALGTVSLADGAAPFLLSLRFTDHILFDGDMAADDGLTALLLLLDVRSWFADLPFAACADSGDLGVEADGTLVLTDGKGGCSEAEKAITDAIKASGRLTTAH